MTVTWMTRSEAKTNKNDMEFQVTVYGRCCIREITGASVYLQTICECITNDGNTHGGTQGGAWGACNPLPMPTMFKKNASKVPSLIPLCDKKKRPLRCPPSGENIIQCKVGCVSTRSIPSPMHICKRSAKIYLKKRFTCSK